MARKYRVAVIGHTGRGDYGHGLHVVWKAGGLDNVELVALADANDKGRADAAKKLGVKSAYADYRTMLEKEKPQIVSVATRHLDQHRDMVVACANAGASIFLEKPMARTLEEADEMVKACEAKHVKLAIAYQTHYSPRLARVKEMLADKLGDLLELRGRGKEDARRGGGEDMMVLGSHIMDLMRYLAGGPAWCFAQVMQGGKPAVKEQVRHNGPEGMGPVLGDQINAMYGLPKGAMGTFGTLRARHGANSRFALWVYGTKGVLRMTTGSLPAVWYCDDPSWMPGQGKKVWQPVTSAGLGKPETLKDGSATAGNVWIVKDLIEAIEKDRQPLASMYDGRASLEMILAVYASHKANAPVALPLKERKHPLATW